MEARVRLPTNVAREPARDDLQRLRVDAGVSRASARDDVVRDSPRVGAGVLPPEATLELGFSRRLRSSYRDYSQHVRPLWQRALLSAIDRTAPAAFAEALAGLDAGGIQAVWVDPAAWAGKQGAFLSMFHSSFASVTAFHAGAGFHAGPRWSVVYAAADVGQLFDSSIVAQDPTLASLKARAMFVGLDGLVGSKALALSVGLAWAAEEDVGLFRESTIARASVRVSPFARRWTSIGLRGRRVVGGTITADRGGELSLDATVILPATPWKPWASIAASRGSTWRFSESRGSHVVAAGVIVANALTLSASAARYETVFGASRWAFHHSVVGGLTLSGVTLHVRYTDGRLGLGPGYGTSLSYEPAPESAP